MENTRIMTLEDYDEMLDAEAEQLRRTIPGMRAELRRDPEGCFGGRGNNFGEAIVAEAENRLGWLMSQGYTLRAHPHIDLLQAGVDLSTIEKVVARDDKLFIGGTPGYRRKKTLRSGTEAEVNWVYDRGQGSWKDGGPPQEVIAAAEAVAVFHGSTLFEWRGEFHVARVYLY